MSTQNFTIEHENIFFSEIERFNKTHSQYPVETITGFSLNNLFSMYQNLEKLFEYFDSEGVKQLLEMVNHDLFEDGNGEENVSLSPLYGHNRIFGVQHLIYYLLRLKSDVMAFDHNARSKEILHNF